MSDHSSLLQETDHLSYKRQGSAIGANIIIKNTRGKILICERADGKGFDIPGGGVDIHKDETPKNGVLREVKEEVGILLDASSVQCIGFLNQRLVGGGYGLVFLYVVDIEEPQELLTTLSEEVRSIQWLQPQTILSDDFAKYMSLGYRRMVAYQQKCTPCSPFEGILKNKVMVNDREI